jgi:hypothetical protein
MTSLNLSEILDHWVVGRTRTLLEPNRTTLQQMSHLPPHLVDDVNARGFPPDRELPPRDVARPPVNKSYGSYKIYSFD